MFQFCHVALALWVSLKRQSSLGEKSLGPISQWLTYQVINTSLSFHMTSQNCFYNCYDVKVTLACTVQATPFKEPSPSSRSLHTEIKDGIHQLQQQPVHQQQGPVQARNLMNLTVQLISTEAHQKAGAVQLQQQAQQQLVLQPWLLESKAAAASTRMSTKPCYTQKPHCTAFMGIKTLYTAQEGRCWDGMEITTLSGGYCY